MKTTYTTAEAWALSFSSLWEITHNIIFKDIKGSNARYAIKQTTRNKWLKMAGWQFVGLDELEPPGYLVRLHEILLNDISQQFTTERSDYRKKGDKITASWVMLGPYIHGRVFYTVNPATPHKWAKNRVWELRQAIGITEQYMMQERRRLRFLADNYQNKN